MKTIFNKIFFIILTFGAIYSCTSEDDNISQHEQVTDIVLYSPDVSNLVLTTENLDLTVLGLSWDDRSDFTGSYTVHVANNAEMENATNLGSVEDNYFSITGSELNTILLNNSNIPFAPQSLYFQVSSDSQMSNSIVVTARPYSLESDLTITAPESGSSFILDGNTPDDNAMTISWESAALSGLSSDIEYTVVMGTAADFENNNVDLGAVTNANSFSISNNQLNSKALALGAEMDQATDFILMINAVTPIYGSDPVLFTSNQVQISITPFTPDIAELAVPGNHQGWNPPAAPRVRASDVGTTDFEGFIWLDGEFKFLEANASGAFEWGNIDYGDDGSFTGLLVADGEVNCNATAAGHYLVRADTNALTYSALMTNWGIIGDSTPGGWDGDTDMTYNSTTGTWEISVTLNNGEMKFRANDGWDLNFGQDGDGDGSLDYGGPNIPVTAGNYLIQLDLSNPRQYTYSLTPQ